MTKKQGKNKECFNFSGKMVCQTCGCKDGKCECTHEYID